MKKLLAVITAVLLSLIMLNVGLAAAIKPLSGVVIESYEDGSFLMDSESAGKVLVKVTEKTVLEGIETVAVGQYLFVAYNGVMTKSLPPQIIADKIACHMLHGQVLSAENQGQSVLMDTEESGKVMVHFQNTPMDAQPGDYLVVYYSGVMALSYPAQVGALKADKYVLETGTVLEMREGYFLLETENGAVRVNSGKESRMPENLQIGDKAQVYYNGQKTFSIPAQIFALFVHNQDN